MLLTRQSCHCSAIDLLIVSCLLQLLYHFHAFYRKRNPIMIKPPAPRHVPNDGVILGLPGSPHSLIVSNLRKLVTKYPPEVSIFPPDELNGLFSGPTSIAYILFKFFQPDSNYDTVQSENCSIRHWANAYLQCAKDCVYADYPCDSREEYRCKESRYGITTKSPSQLVLTAAFH
jgi:hypothetical protein